VNGRSEAVMVFLICAAVLAGSWLLQPNADGTGLQNAPPYGLCLFRAITHLPCPFCGLTTSFTLMSRGRVLEALRCNVLGPPAYLLTWLGLLTGTYGIITRRGALPRWLKGSRAAKVIIAIIAVAWAVNIYIHLAL